MRRAYDRGVESGRGPSGSSDELLGDLELICVSLLILDGAIRVGGTVVKALESLGGNR